MENCIFCKLVKEGSELKVWENENFLAFLDIHPIKTGHTLLIPKKHTEYLFDLSSDEYVELMNKAKIVARILQDKLNSKKIGMVVEGFLIPHAHIHLVPINNGGELNPDNARMDISIDELKKVAEKLNG